MLRKEYTTYNRIGHNQHNLDEETKKAMLAEWSRSIKEVHSSYLAVGNLKDHLLSETTSLHRLSLVR